jgi:hypothetical protein
MTWCFFITEFPYGTSCTLLFSESQKELFMPDFPRNSQSFPSLATLTGQTRRQEGPGGHRPIFWAILAFDDHEGIHDSHVKSEQHGERRHFFRKMLQTQYSRVTMTSANRHKLYLVLPRVATTQVHRDRCPKRRWLHG